MGMQKEEGTGGIYRPTFQFENLREKKRFWNLDVKEKITFKMI